MEPRDDPDQQPQDLSDSESAGGLGATDKKPRRRRRRSPHAKLERIAEVHYCRTDDEANQWLALGPEWDLQDIIPMRVETEDGGERDEIHFIVARWENERDRRRLRMRDLRGVPRSDS